MKRSAYQTSPEALFLEETGSIPALWEEDSNAREEFTAKWKKLKSESPKPSATFLFYLPKQRGIGIFYATTDELAEWIRRADLEPLGWLLDPKKQKNKKEDYTCMSDTEYVPTQEEIDDLRRSVQWRVEDTDFVIPPDAETLWVEFDDTTQEEE